jgi:hypothetical protein
MSRPNSNDPTAKTRAGEVLDRMRKVDEDLLGLAEDVDAAMRNALRPEKDDAVADPSSAGPVRRYIVDRDALVEAWGDTDKLNKLITKARTGA